MKQQNYYRVECIVLYLYFFILLENSINCMKVQINENWLLDICNKVSKIVVYLEYVRIKYLYVKNFVKVYFLKIC